MIDNIAEEPETTWDDIKPGSPAHEKGLAAAKEWDALHHLAWRRDCKDVEHALRLIQNPESYDDLRYAYSLMSEVAERLREARDNPEKRERLRWHDVIFSAAMIGSSKEAYGKLWLENARNSFSANRGEQPGDDAPLIEHATYAIESLLDALLMPAEERAELEKKMRGGFMRWCGENGIRHGHIVNGQFVEAPEPQIIPFPGKPDGGGR